VIDPKSDRIARLDPFPAPRAEDFTDLVILVKAQGKCTTDHISQAGPWLKYRGHLANISNNMYLGAVNAITGEAGKGKNIFTGEAGISFPELAKQYKDSGQGWIVVGDENYGEGSSREHAAMEPRFMGCKVVIVRSFARIAETNLKKQGVLPLTFKNPEDYNKITETAKYDLLGTENLKPGSLVTLRIKDQNNSQDVLLEHSMTDEQIEWFNAGSALNLFGKLGK